MSEKKTQESEQGSIGEDGSFPLECGVIFRCGWCGMPTDKDGALLPGITTTRAANEYLDEKEGDLQTKHVNGACCPSGNEDHAMQDYRYQER